MESLKFGFGGSNSVDKLKKSVTFVNRDEFFDWNY